MTTQTFQTTDVARPPRVNLIPPEIAEGERLRQVQVVMVGAVLVAVAIVGVLFYHEHSGVSSAKQALAQAQAQQTELQGKLNALASVRATFAEVNAKQAQINQALSTEVKWSYVLNDLSLRIPSNVFLTGLTAGETVSSRTAAPGTIGTMTFDGVAFQYDDVATWLDVLAKERGFANPTFSSTAENAAGSRGYVTFGTGVDLTEAALATQTTTTAGS